MIGVFNIMWCVGLWSAALYFTYGIAVLPLALWAYMVFVGQQQRAEKAYARLRNILMPGENLLVEALQLRALALGHRRTLLAITTSRIITVQRAMFGGFAMSDIQWKDLRDVRIEEEMLPNICGSNLYFEHSNEGVPKTVLRGLPSAKASEIYSQAQHEEQAWEEKRRVRQMEETRAASGGVFLNTGAPNSAPSACSKGSMLDQIKLAKEMLDQGVISDAEFQEMKSKMITTG